MIAALSKLTASRKALVFVAIVAGLAVMVHFGSLSQQQFIDFLTVAFPAWLVAHAGEEGARAIGNGARPRISEIVKLVAGLAKPDEEPPK